MPTSLARTNDDYAMGHLLRDYLEQLGDLRRFILMGQADCPGLASTLQPRTRTFRPSENEQQSLPN